jgi:hypothetical protein
MQKRLPLPYQVLQKQYLLHPVTKRISLPFQMMIVAGLLTPEREEQMILDTVPG